MTSKTQNPAFRFFLFYALFWAFWGWLGLILAWTGIFFSAIFAAGILAAAGAFFFWRKKIIFNPGREFAILFAALAVFVIFLSFFSTPTVFSGRDQGALSEAAIRLAQNHEISFSTAASEEFFKIYGPGKALNFPGFHYASGGGLVPQFPLPYIAWLAGFYSFFGLAGLIVANAVLLHLFFGGFYFLSRIFLKTKYALLALALAATSFPLVWFSKFTLSENMALPFLFVSIFSFLLFLERPSLFAFFAWMVFSFLLFFVRIEGTAFFAAGLVLAWIFPSTRNFLKDGWIKKLLLPLSFLAVLVFINFSFGAPFYREIARAFLSAVPDGGGGWGETIILPFFYVLQIHIVYGIFPFLVLGLIGIATFLFRKKWRELVPFFIALPSFWYLVDSNISSDHPWMLRRFAFALLPILIFYAVMFLAKWKERRVAGEGDDFENIPSGNVRVIKSVLGQQKSLVFGVIIAVMLLSNFPAFLKYAFFSENKGLLEQVGAISENFSKNDLVLVDRRVSGDGWAMPAGPMSFVFGINAVYFFNSSDLEKIDRGRFDKIFLITPDANVGLYAGGLLGERLDFFKNYWLKTERLDISSREKFPVLLPDKKTVEVQGKIFEVVER